MPEAKTNLRLRDVAAEIIRKSTAEHPADVTLRETFRAGSFSRADSAEVSRLVFDYYRWRGWLEPGTPVLAGLDVTSRLASAFVSDPRSIQPADLAAKAFPSWLAGEMLVTPELAAAMQVPPAIWLRTHAGQGRQLARKLGGCEIPFETIPDALLYHGSEDLFRTRLFHDGEFELQDLSSQVVGLMCAPAPGQTWWDACAGEGGKTLHLSDLMQNRGLIWASDRAEWRLKILRRRAARAKAFNYRVSPWDGSERLPTKTRFDGALVDAPCSGVGTWQRNPHARWTTTPADVAELAQVQLRLLVNASSLIKPGGRLIYSVCTLTRKETADVAGHFQQAARDFLPEQLPNPLVAGQAANSWTILPQEHGSNGMFIAAWRRT